MIKERGKNSKSSWPKVVVQKWLNIKSGREEFQSDYATRAMAYRGERRKSCSDKDRRVVVPEEISAWLMTGNDGLKRPRFELEQPPVTDPLNLRMFVGTWNVGGKSPYEELNLGDWLGTAAPADIYVLGFQEIVPLNAGNVLGAEDNGPAAKWLSLIRQTLNGNESDPDLSSFYDRATKPRVSFSDLLSLEDEHDNNDFERVFSSVRSLMKKATKNWRAYVVDLWACPFLWADVTAWRLASKWWASSYACGSGRTFGGILTI